VKGSATTTQGFLPPDDALRTSVHNEVHARPSARIRLPALVVDVAVLHEGVTRDMACAHLRMLPGQSELIAESLHDNFLRLRLDGCTVKWERHSEFSRYSVVQALPAHAMLGAVEPELMSHLAVPAQWLQQIPGRTVSAVQLVMLNAPLEDTQALIGLPAVKALAPTLSRAENELSVITAPGKQKRV
jgi:uncharacterized membrane-anchored protein